MGKISKLNEEYAEKIFSFAHQHGGLITQSEAGRILNISSTQINKLAEKGIIKKYSDQKNKTAFIGLSELYTEYIKRKIINNNDLSSFSNRDRDADPSRN